MATATKTPSPTNGSSRPTGGTGRSAGGSQSGAGEAALPRSFDHSVCVFWLGTQCYGLQSSMVGEVFLVESRVPVPVAPAPVVGLFNLRGTPVALVDLAQVLDLPDAAAMAPPVADRTLLALVLRTDTVTVGVHIRKMEAVLPAGRALYHAPDAAGCEHPAVAGFLELPDRPELTITLLERQEVLTRLARLRYRDVEEDEGA